MLDFRNLPKVGSPAWEKLKEGWVDKGLDYYIGKGETGPAVGRKVLAEVERVEAQVLDYQNERAYKARRNADRNLALKYVGFVLLIILCGGLIFGPPVAGFF